MELYDKRYDFNFPIVNIDCLIKELGIDNSVGLKGRPSVVRDV